MANVIVELVELSERGLSLLLAEQLERRTKDVLKREQAALVALTVAVTAQSEKVRRAQINHARSVAHLKNLAE